MTDRLYYADQYMREFTARVVSCEPKGDAWTVTLDRTAFYPEGGGQPGDTGRIGAAHVTGTHERAGKVLHTTDAPLAPGSELECAIDWERRFDLMQQHSGEHIVSGIVHSRFGLDNVGFHMGAEVITIDFSGVLTLGQLREVEYEANRAVWRDSETKIEVLSGSELARRSYRSKKELEGDVRLVEFPGSDVCACCGTHVRRTGEIGCIRLISCQKLRSGVRVEMVSGERAYRYFDSVANANHAVSVALSSPERDTPEALERLFGLNRELKQRAAALEDRLFEDLAGRSSGKTLIFEPDLTPDSVRRLCDAVIRRTGELCCVFSGADVEGYSYALGCPGGDIRGLVREMNAALSGRGGGKNGFAQGRAAASREEITAFFAGKDIKEI